MHARTEADQAMLKKIHKMCDKHLIEFSKNANSWEVVFKVLEMDSQVDIVTGQSKPISINQLF